MTEEGQHTYICIDLKSFYASVECVERHLDPLKANLLVADESRTDKTICLAVSPALKAVGVPGRPRLFEAKQAIGIAENTLGRKIDYIIAPPRMATYIKYSAKVYSMYLKFFSAEDIHVYSVDEVFIDITPYASIYSCSAYDLVRMVIKEILKETGITATGGIGTNMYLAKIAMDIVAKHKPADKDGVRIAELTEDSYKDLLWTHTPITDFWQIAHGISGRLARYGIYTMKDIAEVSVANESLLYQIFGVNAELLIDHAWGREPVTIADIKAYKPKNTCLTSGQVLSCDYEYEKGKLVVKEMADMLCLELLDKGLLTGNISLHVGYSNQLGREPARGSVTLHSPTNSAKNLVKQTVMLFDKIIDKSLPIRRMNLSFNNLTDEAYQQYDLFADPAELEKERKARQAMLDIRKKFGKNAILKGMDLVEGATTMERNRQIGGHRSGE